MCAGVGRAQVWNVRNEYVGGLRARSDIVFFFSALSVGVLILNDNCYICVHDSTFASISLSRLSSDSKLNFNSVQFELSGYQFFLVVVVSYSVPQNSSIRNVFSSPRRFGIGVVLVDGVCEIK
jgi:hypothetical protein